MKLLRWVLGTIGGLAVLFVAVLLWANYQPTPPPITSLALARETSDVCMERGGVPTWDVQSGLVNGCERSSLAGRFTVVNGTPSLARNIMLVDTQTGRTWLVCEMDATKETPVTTAWCAMGVYGKGDGLTE